MKLFVSACLLFTLHAGPFRLSLYGLVLLIGILVGLEIPLIMRILQDRLGFKELVSRVLSVDYLGALAVSVLFPLLLAPHLGLVRSALLFGLLNALVAAWALWLFRDRIGPVAALHAQCVAVLGVLAVAFGFAGNFVSLAEANLYNEDIVHAESSAYQRIVVTRQRDETRLYLNHNLQFSSRDEYRYHEALVHPGLAGLPWARRILVLGGGEVSTNAQGEATYDYRVPVVGYLRIETIVDDNGKQIISEGGSLYATDRNNRWADYAYRDWDEIKLVPDKKSYKPGEVAHVLAMLPADQTHLLVTTELNQVLSARRIDVAGRAAMIDVPIEARYSPNVYLSVAFVKNGELYTSDKLLSVPAQDRFLNLEILPDKKEYKPRDPAAYTIIARNADGSPASGVEVSLGVVDEAIYSVQPDQTGDIRRAFYGRRYNAVRARRWCCVCRTRPM